MARRGENIRKRSDGRWEGRYIKGRTTDGKPFGGYIYTEQPIQKFESVLSVKRQNTVFII